MNHFHKITAPLPSRDTPSRQNPSCGTQGNSPISELNTVISVCALQQCEPPICLECHFFGAAWYNWVQLREA